MNEFLLELEDRQIQALSAKAERADRVSDLYAILEELPDAAKKRLKTHL